MGYAIKIGNGVRHSDGHHVEVMHDVPGAPDDGHGEHSNSRWPSYNGWTDFADGCGLYDLFWHPQDGLMVEHPGCAVIKPAHYETVKRVLDGQRARQTITPYDMGRLVWLEFWMRWALANCDQPMMTNC